MIRKSLFLGLTLVLVVALITLIVRGRQMEKQQPPREVEVVQQSKPTATRVLGPRDLEILQSKMRWEGEVDGMQPSRTARHEIEIRNNGDVPYGEIQLRFTYLAAGGKTLIDRTHVLTKELAPGASLKIEDIVAGDIPVAAENSRVTIDYADLGPASNRSK